VHRVAHRLLATLGGAGAMTLAVACGGTAPGTSFPSSGHGSPQAAVIGFLMAASAGHAAQACGFVLAADVSDCSGGLAAAGLSAHGVRAGAVAVQGDQALVTVVGKVCANGDDGPTCSTNDDPAAGQPTGPGAAAFAAAYQQALSGTGPGDPAIPCARSGSGWYVNLGSST
jgi:hypothetical protein